MWNESFNSWTLNQRIMFELKISSIAFILLLLLFFSLSLLFIFIYHLGSANNKLLTLLPVLHSWLYYLDLWEELSKMKNLFNSISVEWTWIFALLLRTNCLEMKHLSFYNLISMYSVFIHTLPIRPRKPNKNSVYLGFFDKRKWIRILYFVFHLMRIIWGDGIHNINPKMSSFWNEIEWMFANITIILMDQKSLLFELIQVIAEDENISWNRNLEKLIFWPTTLLFWCFFKTIRKISSLVTNNYLLSLFIIRFLQ